MSSSTQTLSTKRPTRTPIRTASNRYLTCIGEGENEVTFCPSGADAYTVAYSPEEAEVGHASFESGSTTSLSSACQSTTDEDEEPAVQAPRVKKSSSYTRLLKKKIKQFIHSSMDSKTEPSDSILFPPTLPTAPLFPSINTIPDRASTFISAEDAEPAPKASSLFRFRRRRNSNASKTPTTRSSDRDTLGTDNTSNHRVDSEETRSAVVRRSRSFSDSTSSAGIDPLAKYIAHLEKVARANMQRELDRQRELQEEAQRHQAEKAAAKEALDDAALNLAERELESELAWNAPILSDNQEFVVEDECEAISDALDKAMRKLAEVELERELVERGSQRLADDQDLRLEEYEDAEEALDRAVEEFALAMRFRRESTTFLDNNLFDDDENEDDGIFDDGGSRLDGIFDEATEEALELAAFMKEGGWVLR